jgi:hypothetical protein
MVIFGELVDSEFFGCKVVVGAKNNFKPLQFVQKILCPKGIYG